MTGDYVLVDELSMPDDVVLLSYLTENLKLQAEVLQGRGDLQSAVLMFYAANLIDLLRRRLAGHLQGVH